MGPNPQTTNQEPHNAAYPVVLSIAPPPPIFSMSTAALRLLLYNIPTYSLVSKPVPDPPTHHVMPSPSADLPKLA